MDSTIELRSFCEAVLLNLKSILGKRAYVVVMTHVIDDYFGNIKKEQEDIYAAIMKRPDIFESAMIDLLGYAGKILLRQSLAITTLGVFSYSKNGDFVKCLATVKKELQQQDPRNNRPAI